jgi:hypothetical protein
LKLDRTVGAGKFLKPPALSRIHLVWQNVNDTRIDRKERIELIGYSNALSFGSEKKCFRVCIKGIPSGSNFDQLSELFCCERTLDFTSALQSNGFDQRFVAKWAELSNFD